MNAPAINTERLFTASRIAVGATAARFVAISAIMAPLKDCFGLDNEQVGWIGGAGLWGFTLTMLVFGSLCDLLGMKLVFRLAMLAHLAGADVAFANLEAPIAERGDKKLLPIALRAPVEAALGLIKLGEADSGELRAGLKSFRRHGSVCSRQSIPRLLFSSKGVTCERYSCHSRRLFFST